MKRVPRPEPKRVEARQLRPAPARIPSGGLTMSRAIRQASNVVVAAAQLYKELAVSAIDLFRPENYR